LPGFEQYIKCGTRKDRTLDKCYGNVKKAYEARVKPPLANSDHNTIHLIPTYRTMLKRSKPCMKEVTVWSDDAIERLKGCFHCTDWNVFNDMDIDTTTETITEYINFCVDNVLTKKNVMMYPNNKLYITKEIKSCINRKNAAFRNQDFAGLKIIQKELNHKIKEARGRQKDLIERQFSTGNSRKMWDAMKAVTNMETNSQLINTSDDLQKANELNDFYLRFQTHDFSDKCRSVIGSLMDDMGSRLIIDSSKVQLLFRQLCTKKSMGPDGISAQLLKTCAAELTPVWCTLFQRSLDSHIVPALWKKAVIIPIPKKPHPLENNDFRPVALTSIIMKCFEKYIVSLLKNEVMSKLDPWQFGCSDDAVGSITHLVSKHLDDSKAYAHLLFIDL